MQFRFRASNKSEPRGKNLYVPNGLKLWLAVTSRSVGGVAASFRRYSSLIFASSARSWDGEDKDKEGVTTAMIGLGGHTGPSN